MKPLNMTKAEVMYQRQTHDSQSEQITTTTPVNDFEHEIDDEGLHVFKMRRKHHTMCSRVNHIRVPSSYRERFSVQGPVS